MAPSRGAWASCRSPSRRPCWRARSARCWTIQPRRRRPVPPGSNENEGPDLRRRDRRPHPGVLVEAPRSGGRAGGARAALSNGRVRHRLLGRRLRRRGEDGTLAGAPRTGLPHRVAPLRAQGRPGPGGAARRCDVVVGRDGRHSTVRRRAFGPQERFETYLGYFTASFASPGYPHRDAGTYVSYTAPGRQISRYALRGDVSAFFFVWTP